MAIFIKKLIFRVFGIYSHISELEKQIEALGASKVPPSLPSASSSTVFKYCPVQIFDTKNIDFIMSMAKIADMKEFVFYLVNSRENFFEAMRMKRGEEKIIMQGYIEAVDLVLKELTWFKENYKAQTNVQLP